MKLITFSLKDDQNTFRIGAVKNEKINPYKSYYDDIRRYEIDRREKEKYSSFED